jgi:hypothetical protein
LELIGAFFESLSRNAERYLRTVGKLHSRGVQAVSRGKFDELIGERSGAGKEVGAFSILMATTLLIELPHVRAEHRTRIIETNPSVIRERSRAMTVTWIGVAVLVEQLCGPSHSLIALRAAFIREHRLEPLAWIVSGSLANVIHTSLVRCETGSLNLSAEAANLGVEIRNRHGWFKDGFHGG